MTSTDAASGCRCCSTLTARRHWLGLCAGTLAAVVLPKCPLCWAAYLAVLGLSGAVAAPLMWLRPIAIAVALLSATALAVHALRARRTRATAP